MSDTLLADTSATATTDTTATTTTDATTQQQTTTTTAPKGFVGEDGNFQDGWLDRLPPDLAEGKATLAKYRNFTELVKGHTNLQSLMGKKASAVNIPGEGATPEDIGAFRKAFGVPDKAEDYKLKPETLPAGVAWDDTVMKGYADIALKHHIPAKAMQELTAYNLAQETARAEEMGGMFEAQVEQGRTALKTEWGANYDKNIGMAVRVAKTYGINPESSGLRDPEMVKLLVRVGASMSEDKLISSDFSPSLENGKLAARDIMTNKTNPLFEKYQNGDPDTVARVRGMLQHG